VHATAATARRNMPLPLVSSARVQWPAVTTVARTPFRVHRTFRTCLFVTDWGEAFRLFDVDNAGHIDARKLFNVIRLLGYNPTEAEVQDLIAAGDKDGVL